ncbi:MAG TPA: mechanosensitive ion channel [Nannocystis exedens]|nr:mechanosensitive ion channel [Nannocystis exedens]
MTQALAVSIVVVLGLFMGLVPLPQATVGLGSGKEVAKVAEQVVEQVAEVPLPGRYELIPRSAEIESEAEDALAQIERTGRDAAIIEGLGVARRRRASTRDQLAGLEHETYLRPERIAQIREQARLQRSEIEREDRTLRARLKSLEDLRAAWIERRSFWRAWRDSLGHETDPSAAGRQEFRRALATIGRVLDEGNATTSRLLGHQRALAEVRRDLLSLEIHADELIRRGDRLRWTRDAPALFSASYTRRLFAVSSDEIREGIAGTPGIDPAFLDRVRWVLLMHIGLCIGFALLLTRVRRHLDSGGSTSGGLLMGPWRTGIFVATATVSFLYQPMPGVWEAGMLVILALTGAALAPKLLPRGERGLAYLLAVVYPPLFLLGVVAFPAPLVRLLLVVLCMVGSPLLLREARRERVQSLRSRVFKAGLYLGSAELLVALIAQIAGFERFARWLVESLIATAFVIYVVIILFELGSGVGAALSRVEARADASFLERAGARFSSQLRWVFRAMMLVGAVFYAGSIWGFIDSATEIGEKLASLELRGGELHVRLGSLVLASITIYLAFVLSWAVRTLLDIHVFEPRRVEAGVGESIKIIFHYTVVVFGVFAGLAALGISLQSFALVFGALGVGIGFGLQNIVGNFFSGLILLFERPVRVGDTVVIAGDMGVVRKIGLRSTIVLATDHTEIIVPNSDLISEKVINWTLSHRRARIVVKIGVAYGSDVAQVLGILEAAGRRHPLTIEHPPTRVLFVGFGESSLNFELWTWIRDADDRFRVPSELYRQIEAEFRTQGIVIPFPQRDLHLRTVEESAALAMRDSKV